jgi:hypothetical protein
MKVEKSGLPRKYKVWIYQLGIISRLMWLLLIYEVVEGIERVEQEMVCVNISRAGRTHLGIS